MADEAQRHGDGTGGGTGGGGAGGGGRGHREGRGAGARAYVGSFTSAGGRGVLAATVNPRTGALTVTGASDAVPDPSFLVPAPGGEVLYAVSETEEGAVAAFDVTGPAPRLLGDPAPVRGTHPTHLALAHGHALTANYGSGSVSALPLGPGGAPEPAGGVLHHHGTGPHPERQTGPHAHQVVPAPGGRWVLSVDLGTDSVHVSALDPMTGELTPHGRTALRPGSGPRHLAFHPSGSHAYVLAELAPTLTACRWDPASGSLVPVGEPAVLPTRPGEEGESYPSGIVAAPDGRFLWAAVRGDDAIAVLALDGSRERPVPVATVPCGGHWPRDLTLDPRGRRLYVANERSGDVTWFDLDPETGLPSRAGSIEAPAASCVVFA
ncbi:lactonase family protein [Streptomyces ficellus]|uniref:Lactonase family protein n=1 Tax=Streptomyces ficellus TaxID=1977088 RepID=A0A6I6FDX3_9ACTN|nr:lactonase family protein [Streptomyces ficellus]QGV81890.1 lactonase family protein [Streptomyces ficellus]